MFFEIWFLLLMSVCTICYSVNTCIHIFMIVEDMTPEMNDDAKRMYS